MSMVSRIDLLKASVEKLKRDECRLREKIVLYESEIKKLEKKSEN